jgi:hypothetical protein
MRVLLVVFIIIALLLVIPGMALAGSPGTGPAPNSGDGVPDGSGLHPIENPGRGPAPNSGDGISDGSGF